MSDMTREKAKQILEDGGILFGRSWSFSKNYWTCFQGCCEADEDNVEDMLDTIESFCDWDEVTEDE